MGTNEGCKFTWHKKHSETDTHGATFSCGGTDCKAYLLILAMLENENTLEGLHDSVQIKDGNEIRFEQLPKCLPPKLRQLLVDLWLIRYLSYFEFDNILLIEEEP